MKHIYINLFFFFTIATAFSQTTVSSGFNHNGIDREYRIYIPASYQEDEPAPLVFNLHGYGSNNIEQELYSQLGLVADTAGFLLVHPNGTLDITGTNHWNTFGTSTVDDVGFLSDLIDTIAANYNVDLQRVYSTGMSNGGFMSFSLACQLSNRIAAIASVTGTMTNFNLNACVPERTVPIMQIHGTADATVPYDGNFLFTDVQTLLNFWINYNQTNTEALVTFLPDIDPNDGSTAEHYLYGNGLNGSVVEHYKIIGGGHSWPGAPININITNMDFSASAEIWRFFKQYDLQGLITDLEGSQTNENVARAYPNPAQGIFYLELPPAMVHLVHIFDVQGRLVHSVSTSRSNLQIPLQQSGFYLIQIKNDKGIQQIKLVNTLSN